MQTYLKTPPNKGSEAWYRYMKQQTSEVMKEIHLLRIKNDVLYRERNIKRTLIFIKVFEKWVEEVFCCLYRARQSPFSSIWETVNYIRLHSSINK